MDYFQKRLNFSHPRGGNDNSKKEAPKTVEKGKIRVNQNGEKYAFQRGEGKCYTHALKQPAILNKHFWTTDENKTLKKKHTSLSSVLSTASLVSAASSEVVPLASSVVVVPLASSVEVASVVPLASSVAGASFSASCKIVF